VGRIILLDRKAAVPCRNSRFERRVRHGAAVVGLMLGDADEIGSAVAIMVPDEPVWVVVRPSGLQSITPDHIRVLGESDESEFVHRIFDVGCQGGY
jgi:hypothetical protein